MGAKCQEDADCRRGTDCYKGVCTQVCSPDEPCPDGLNCEAYRCVAAEAEATVSTPPLPKPDPVAAELRAIRLELETIRRQQEELLERLEPAP